MAAQHQFKPDDVARQTFGTAFRGFDQMEVRAFLAEVAGELAAARERERILREALALAEAKGQSAAPGIGDLDAAIGIESGKVLQAARQAAAEIRTRAEEQVGRLVREATDDATRIREEAKALLVRSKAEAQTEAEQIKAEAARSGKQEAEEAVRRSREMVAEAQAVRERVMQDLNRRRQHAQQQLDQLRAGRERLLAAYRVVRTTLEEATAELTVAEAESDADADVADGALEADVRMEELLAGILVGNDTATLGIDPPAGEASADVADADASGSDEPDPESAPSTVAVDDGPDLSADAPDDVTDDAPDDDGGASDEVVDLRPVARPATAGPVLGPNGGGPRARRRRAEPAAHGPRAARPPSPDLVLPSDDFEGVRILSPEEAARRAPAGAVATTDRAATRAARAAIGTRKAPTGGTAAEVDDDADIESAEEVPAAPTLVEAADGVDPAEADADVSVVDEPGARSTPEPASGPEADPEADPEARVAPEPDAEAPQSTDAEPAQGSEPEAPAAVEPEPSAEPEVDDLFARIRARREKSVAAAEALLAEPDDPGPAESDDEVPRVASVGSEEAFEQRDLQVESIERTLIKGLKRSLADEQNEVLDALRRAKKTPTLDDVLPSPDEHVARHLAVATTALERASRAGAGAEPAADVADLAGALARTVADDVRERLREAIDLATDDDEALVESISAIYREWKTARVAPLAVEHVVEAYGRARYAAAPDGALRWLVDGTGACGPDCEDNALAGDNPKGEPFPTGHLHPPAHPACRCLLLPV